MITEVLRAGATGADARADADGCGSDGFELARSEREAIRGATRERRREFRTARRCAHQALDALGVAARELPRRPSGAPRWPDGVVGSVTHCAGYRAAAVAWAADLAALGIDAEPDAPLPIGVLELVTNATERKKLARLIAGDPAIAWDRLLFSAKESVFKALGDDVQTGLSLRDIELELGPGTFSVGLRASSIGAVPVSSDLVAGRWIRRCGLLVTAATVGR